MPKHQLHLHHYPRQEILADQLLTNLSTEGGTNPFHTSSILVRNQGMATWLRQRIASATGIAMQVEFPQPNAFLKKILGDHTIHLDDFKWPLYQALSNIDDSKELEIIRQYLTSPDSKTRKSLKRYQLADQIAVLFDKYLLTRPDWIQAWNKNKPAPTTNPHEPWQRILWNTVTDTQHKHWTQILLDTEKLNPATPLPSALHVFGISNLAPIYVRFLHLLSLEIPVHIYWMNPVSADQGYWEDAPTAKQWILANAFQDTFTLTEGNPLLSSFGRMGREFIHTIYGGNTGNIDPINTQTGPAEISTSPTTLGKIQNAIHHRKPIPSDISIDPTVQIHACHTPLRELETLKTYLLTLAETSPLDTADILVLCPDIQIYTPGIKAIFGSDPTLPYRIADRSTPLTDPTIAAILSLFTLNTARFTNLQALDLLSIPAISNLRDLTENDLDLIRTWITETGIHWGFDQDHVKQVAPATQESPWTWQQGLDRLTLGYAMPNPSGTNTLWNGIPPYHHIEGSITKHLSALTEFIDWCSKIRKSLTTPKPLTDWITKTKQWLSEGLDQSPETLRTLQPLNEALENILKQAPHLTESIPVEVFAEHLKRTLADSASSPGFLNGSITFCEMKPMRAIPARTICLLGLNHDSFPRSTAEVQFDLTKNNRIPGDRNTRDDDTYLFLEAILSARESLYLSYIGAAIKDGTTLPPSSALQTLIDATPGLTANLTREKLHPFDPAYFNSKTPISHNKTLLKAAQTLPAAPSNKTPKPNFQNPNPPEPRTVLSITEFTKSITKTANYYYQNVLQARTRYDQTPLSEDEPITLDGLAIYNLKNQIVTNRQYSPELVETWQKNGTIPPASLGQLTLDNQLGNIKNLLEDLPDLTPLPIQVEIDGITIQGHIDLTEDNTVTHISASKKAKANTILTTWIAQLLASHQLETPTPAQLLNIETEINTTQINPPKNHQASLKTLIKLYKENLTSPQPHLPLTAHAYYSKPITDPDQLEKQLKAARSAYTTTSFGGKTFHGEDSDTAVATLFPPETIFTDTDLTEAVKATCEPIWSDVISHLA